MSSDLCVFDESLFLHSSPQMVPSESFTPIIDSFLQSSGNKPNMEADSDDPCFLDQFITGLTQSSQMENLSLYESTQLRFLSNGSNLGNGSDLGHRSATAHHSYSAGENVVKMTQRSYSSSYSDRQRTGFCFQPIFDTVAESPETGFFAGQLRRVCSAGDLKLKPSSQTHSAQSSFMEESSFKVGRYSAEERKERILKYRAKRNQRNFNKTIKYACRKTLADNRPRIRGRFARNDETGETPKASYPNLDEEDDEFLLDGLLEEHGGHGAFMGLGGGPLMKHFDQTQFQYYGY